MSALLVLQIVFSLGASSGLGAPGTGPDSGPPPQTVSLTATGDAYVLDALPSRNFGGSNTLVVGRDPASGSTYRSVLQFDVSSVPSYAKVGNATLKIPALAVSSPGGGVDVFRVRAPWTEGTGSEAYATNLTVSETANVARTREPVVVHLAIGGGGLSTTPREDFLLFDSLGREVPSQVFNVTTVNGKVVGLDLAFESTHARLESKTFTLRYGLSLAGVPSYRTRGLSSVPLWTYPVSSGSASPVVADLDGDGRLEVVVGTTDGRVIALRWDGVGLVPLWTYAAPGAIVLPIRVADLTGDGTQEVLFENSDTTSFNHTLTALSAAGRYLWHVRLPGPPTGPFAAADTNGDGVVEVFTGAAMSNSSFYAIRGSDGAILCQYTDLGSTADAFGMAVGDVVGTTGPEIAFTDTAGKLRIRNPNCLITLPGNTKPGAARNSAAPSVANLSFDAHREIVMGDRGGSNSREFVVSGLNWTTLASSPVLGADVMGQIVADADRDGVPEVYVVTQDGALHRLTRNLAQSWVFVGAANGTTACTPAAADIDLDGRPEILYGTNGSVLYAVSSGGAEAWRWVVDSPVVASPVVADLDGDGTLEVIVATDNSSNPSRPAMVYAFGTGSLGHDTRTVGYNTADTGVWLDGNSPEGRSLLRVTLGPTTPIVSGVTWTTRDGSAPWANPGIDLDPSRLATAIPAAGTAVSWNVTGLVRAWVNGSSPNTGVALKSSDESTPWNVTFASREYGPGYAAILEVSFTADPSPRILYPVPDQMRMEDSPPWSLDLLPYAWDPDTPLTSLRWDLVGINASLVQVLGTNVTGNHVLTFRPVLNANGVSQGVLYLFDPEGHFDSQPLRVELVPVDDAPRFDPPGVFYVRHDVPYTFDFEPYMSDVDDPVSSLTLTTNDTAHVSVVGHRATFLFPSAFVNRWAYVILAVSDPTGLAASQVVAVKVSTDYPPQLRVGLPDVTLFEGETRVGVFDLDNYFADPDSDSLFFSYGNTHLVVTINADHTVDMSAPSEWTGEENITFRAEDPTGAIAEDSIVATVIPIDDPPTIAPLPAFVVHFDYPFDFDLTPYVSDPDTPLDQLVVETSNPANVTVTGRVLTILYPAQLGALTVPYIVPLTITVRDARTPVSANTTVRVVDNFPPRLLKTLPDRTFPEDTTLTRAFYLDSYFVDIDGSVVAYTSRSVNIRAVINADHSVDLSAPVNWSGTELVTFRATDDRGAFTEDTARIVVAPVNDAPVISGLPKQVHEGLGSWVLDVTPYVYDSDNPTSSLLVTTEGHPRVHAVGMFLVFDYEGEAFHEWVDVFVSDGELTAETIVEVEVIVPNPLFLYLPVAVAGAVAVSVFVGWRRFRTQIEEVFLATTGGLAVCHLSRTLTPDRDTDIVTAMFTAVQIFAKQSMSGSGGGEMSGLALGHSQLVIGHGEFVYLAILFHGIGPLAERRVQRRARGVVREIEVRFGVRLKNWSGIVSDLADVRSYLETLFEAKEAGLPETKEHGRRPWRRRGATPVEIAKDRIQNGRP